MSGDFGADFASHDFFGPLGLAVACLLVYIAIVVTLIYVRGPRAVYVHEVDPVTEALSLMWRAVEIAGRKSETGKSTSAGFISSSQHSTDGVGPETPLPESAADKYQGGGGDDE